MTLWDDETQKGYEKWERAHGNEPPKVKIPTKEVKMPIGPDIHTGKDEKEENTLKKSTTGEAPYTLPTGTGDVIKIPEIFELQERQSAPPKRTRRPKGVAPGIQVTITKTATIPLTIPERPEGFEKVVISIAQYAGGFADVTDIEWPDGMTALDAITAFLIRPAK